MTGTSSGAGSINPSEASEFTPGFSFDHCVVCPSSIYGIRIGGVMVSVLTSNVVDHGFEPPSVQTKDNKIGMCCFSAKHAVLRSMSKQRQVGSESE